MRGVMASMLFLGFVGVAQAGDAPGAIDARVTQSNIAMTICMRSWTRSVRPPWWVTAPIKRRMAAEQGVDARDYELDHVVPLDLGGAPLDLRNLQLQLWRGPCNARQKDAVEVETAKAVCEGDVTLVDARHDIAADWRSAYKDYIDPRGCGE
jgi:hypothetical protein